MAVLVAFPTGADGGCFPAGTEVLTRAGSRAIESVREGSSVYAYDFSAGAWVVRPVRRLLSHAYRGELVTIRFGSDSFEARANHPLYVVRGEKLGARPRPRDLPEGRTESLSPGRWVEAGDIVAGDRLRSLRGSSVNATAVSRRSAALPVYNLDIAGGESYVVHRAGILVHNKGQAEGEEPQKLVTGYGRVTLEHYEVNVVGAEEPDALLRWLRENGYQVSSAARTVLADYIGRGWAFVAVKLSPNERRRYENELLPPLTIEYRFGKLIYPLRISSVSTAGAVRITLYVIAESTVSSSNFRTQSLSFEETFDEKRHDLQAYVEAGIKRTVGAEGRGLAVLWKGVYPNRSYRSSEDASLDPIRKASRSSHVKLAGLDRTLPNTAQHDHRSGGNDRGDRTGT